MTRKRTAGDWVLHNTYCLAVVISYVMHGVILHASVTRRLFKHCNLTWDDRALRFYETDRQVLTHSAGQVRRPLYNGSIGAWRNFEEELLPMVSMRVLACLLLQTIFVKAMTFFSDGG